MKTLRSLRFLDFFRRSKNNTDDKLIVCTDNDDVSVSVRRVSQREFYDTEWQVDIISSEATVSVKITRYDTETAVGLEKEIRRLKAYDISALKALDQQNKIWYD